MRRSSSNGYIIVKRTDRTLDRIANVPPPKNSNKMHIAKLKCTDCNEITELKDIFFKRNVIKKDTKVDNETFETLEEDKVAICWNCGGTEFYAIVEGEER